jgi:uncharacterized protein
MTAFGLRIHAPITARDFRGTINQRDFPCVGAKSALARGSLSIIHACNITLASNDFEIHNKLLEWSNAFGADPSGLRSLAVIFDEPVTLNEQKFESALWQRIQSLSDKDHRLGHQFAPGVSGNPDDPHFSLSFGGQAYFVVGLHPEASRLARRFSRPAMVFNLHDQFVRLREEGKYERMREAILARDEAFAGSTNPMIARHGEVSEARQYSGRRVGGAWQCPFQDPRE